MNSILARAKALVPLVAYGIAYVIQHGFDVKQLASLTGIKEFAAAVVVAVLVHSVPNKTA